MARSPTSFRHAMFLMIYLVHSLKGKDAYYIGVFLVGAYQEILGDMHNLFGDTNAVHVTVDEKGYNIEQVSTTGKRLRVLIMSSIILKSW